MPENHDAILLLGQTREIGAELVKLLAGAGYRPKAASWGEFNPRGWRRGERPAAILANIDSQDAPDTAEFCRKVKKFWGEHFPVIATTAAQKVMHIAALLDKGIYDCFPPLPSVKLLEWKIARAIKQNTAPSASELTEEVPGNLLGVFMGNGNENANLVRLGDLVSIHAGATPRRPWCRRVAPPDDSWKGVMTSDAMDRFHVGKPVSYLLWSRLHLFRLPPAEEYSVPEKVLLSRSGPPLAAAVDKSRLPAGTDVYSLVPREGVGAGYVACLLNSRLLDFYFNRLADNPDGRLRAESIRDTPAPRPTPEVMAEFARYSALLSHFGSSPQSWIDRQSREEIAEQMEAAVFALYGAGNEVREGLAAMHF